MPRCAFQASWERGRTRARMYGRVWFHFGGPRLNLLQKQTSTRLLIDVRFTPKTDIAQRDYHVRFVPIADIEAPVGYDCK